MVIQACKDRVIRNFYFQLCFAWLIVCMILFENMVLILQKCKQAKTSGDLNSKKSWLKKRNSGPQWDSNTQCQRCSLMLNKWAKVVKVHDFMPNLKVGRFMPVVVDNTTLLFCRRRILVTTEANLRTNLSSLTISFKSPLFTLLCFYKIQLPFPRSASKIQSHIQSTVNYIFEQLPYFSGISSLGLVAPEVFGIPANTLLWEESK